VKSKRQDTVDYHLYRKSNPEVVLHRSIAIGGICLEDMCSGHLFEGVRYQMVDAQYYGICPNQLTRRLVAVIKAKFDEHDGAIENDGMIKETIVMEGARPWSHWFDKVYILTLSPDGNRLAAVVKENGKFRIAVNDELWGTSFDEEFYWRTPKFSPDSRRLAVTVIRDRKVVVVADDKPWDSLACLVPERYSGDSASDSFMLCANHAYINNQQIFQPHFTPNGKCVVPLTTSLSIQQRGLKPRWTIAVDGKAWGTDFVTVDGFWMAFDENGRVAIPVSVEKLGSRTETVAVDGKLWENRFDTVTHVKFLPDGRVAAEIILPPEGQDRRYFESRQGVAVDDSVIGLVHCENSDIFGYKIKRSPFSKKRFTVIGYTHKSGKQKRAFSRTY